MLEVSPEIGYSFGGVPFRMNMAGEIVHREDCTMCSEREQDLVRFPVKFRGGDQTRQSLNGRTSEAFQECILSNQTDYTG